MKTVNDLLELMRMLRDPETGCPWDQKQTYKSIVPHTLEEAYEVAHAIEHECYDELKLELGDLLFQIIFYSQLAQEEGRFGFEEVVDGICSKMIHRHPHVFAEGKKEEYSKTSWEQLKKKERESKSKYNTGVLTDIAINLPALTRAMKLQKRAASVGFDWDDILPIIDKLYEEMDEISEVLSNDQGHDRLMEEVGDLMFVCVNLARHLNIDPEQSLRVANDKFERRFQYIEKQLKKEEKDIREMDLEYLDKLWEQAKVEEKKTR